MLEKLVLQEDDLADNPTSRVPVVLCLDTSGSMSGAPIEELNAGIGQFYAAVRGDDIAKYAAEIAIVTFGGGVDTISEFESVLERSPPVLQAGGGTPMGEAVSEALDGLESRKTRYASAGVDYYQPWLVLMTDGQPTDSIDAAVDRLAALVEKRKLSVFPVAIGPAADLEVLKRLSPAREPLRLKGLNFSEFFEWLSKSVSRTSQSVPGQSVPLDRAGLGSWAQV